MTYSPTGKNTIRIRDLVKQFDKSNPPALKSLNAVIKGGCVTGLAGPDGAGKTTLLRLICGLLIPEDGYISVYGYDAERQTPKVRELIGYMPQKFGLYEDLSVMENLKLYAELRSVPLEVRNERYERLLSFTKLAPFTERLAGRLSGGMKQKLGLACTLLAEPPILLLDEPGVGVDPVARRELWGMIRDLVSDERVIVWSTAYLDEAEACDTVLLLNEGELLYEGTPKELTSTVDKRVFLVDGAGEWRRSLIVPLMERSQTMDVVIQGSKVRVLTRDKGEELRSSLEIVREESLKRLEKDDSAIPKITSVSVEARFEDAFMDILGGARHPEPLMAQLFKKKFSEGSKSAVETVKADHLIKRFGDFTAVDDVSFSIKQGEVFGLLGPNGAGKSTTFKMMCGLSMPTDGHCSVVGLNFRTAPGKARGRLGYMAQKFSLYGDLTVLQNLNFFAGTYGMKGKVRKQAVNYVVDALEFERYLNTPAGSLPLGYKQRLSLGCAIMHGPDVLFLDEPTSGVDPVTRREFWTYINNAVELGVTVLVTTHFMDEAEYCDRIALIYKGKVIASGSPDDLKAEIASHENPDPTLEDAFITLIEKNDAEQG